MVKALAGSAGDGNQCKTVSQQDLLNEKEASQRTPGSQMMVIVVEIGRSKVDGWR